MRQWVLKTKLFFIDCYVVLLNESIKSAASVFTARLKRKERHAALCHCGHINCWEGHERRKTSETSLTIHTIRLIHHIQHLTRWMSVCLTLKSLHADRPNGPTEALPWLRKQLTDKGSRICIIFCQSPVQEGSERLTSDVKMFHVLKVRKKFKFIRKLSKMGTVSSKAKHCTTKILSMKSHYLKTSVWCKFNM